MLSHNGTISTGYWVHSARVKSFSPRLQCSQKDRRKLSIWRMFQSNSAKCAYWNYVSCMKTMTMPKIGGCVAWSIKFFLLPTRIQTMMITAICVDCGNGWTLFNHSVRLEMHRTSSVCSCTVRVRTIWLTPIQSTMWKDYGYDISNFCGVDPQYVDYFIWHEGKNKGRDRPTNWIGASGQHMWTFARERSMYYVHQFLDSQPDLNYRNTKVLKEMDGVLRFWLEMGVDGSRVDSSRHLFENGQFRDEHLSKEAKGADPEVDYDAYSHTETADQPSSYGLIRHWRQFLDDYSRDNNRDYLVLLVEVRGTERVLTSLVLRHRLTATMWRRWWISTLLVERNVAQIWRSTSTSPTIWIRKGKKSMFWNWISNAPNGKTMLQKARCPTGVSAATIVIVSHLVCRRKKWSIVSTCCYFFKPAQQSCTMEMKPVGMIIE